MNDIHLTIDGVAVSGPAGLTILQAADKAGIKIPTLCYSPDLKPRGVCRVCLVEVEGSRTLMAACYTPISRGMVVQTRSPKVLETRKTIIELLLTAHTGSCVTDLNAKPCALHKLAADLEVGPPRFQVSEAPAIIHRKTITPMSDGTFPNVFSAAAVSGPAMRSPKSNVLSVGYRGFQSKIIVDLDGPLKKEVCKDCGICIDYCPTGALSKPANYYKEGLPKMSESNRHDLLPFLKQTQTKRVIFGRRPGRIVPLLGSSE